MKAQIYQTKQGYDIINSEGYLFSVVAMKVQKKGKVNDKFQPSGKLLKKIPNHIKEIFYSLQTKSDDQSPRRSESNLHNDEGIQS